MHSLFYSLSDEKLVKFATYASVVTAALLIVIKFSAWLTTGSLSLQASLADSLLDALASLLNLVAVHYSFKQPDDKHSFGHGKAEPLAGLGQSMFILGSSVWLFIQAIYRFYKPEPIQESFVGIVVMLVAVALTSLLVMFQRYVVNRTRTVAIEADMLHYRSDILVNVAVMICFILSYFFSVDSLDTILGGLIALYIFKTSIEIAKKALDVLMDREIPLSLRQSMEKIILETEGVNGLQGLKTRSAGLTIFIQFHLDVEPTLSLSHFREIAEKVRENLKQNFPNAEILIYHP